MRRGFWFAVAGVLAAGLLVGWWWAPFGQPKPAVDVPVVTAGPSEVTYAGLAGGECLATFDAPTQAGFAVADCAEAHPAQFLGRVPVSQVISGEAWPGSETLGQWAQLACQSLLADPSTPGLESWVRVPQSEAEWNAGVRDYGCFVSASEPLTGSLAG